MTGEENTEKRPQKRLDLNLPGREDEKVQNKPVASATLGPANIFPKEDLKKKRKRSRHFEPPRRLKHIKNFTLKFEKS